MMIEEKDTTIEELKREILETKTTGNIKYESALKETSLAQENLKSGKKLCELYASDNEALQAKETQMDKELGLLKTEIQFLEAENQRVGADNVSLSIHFLGRAQ